jgi:hypothetical protein
LTARSDGLERRTASDDYLKMNRALVLALLLCLTSIWSGLSGAAEVPAFSNAKGPRMALVIGNSAYKVAPLDNPVRDARLVAQSLTAVHFKVTKLENATQEQMLQAIVDLGNAVSKGGIGLFYYAGHGVQLRGENYLIPVDARIDREEAIRSRAVNAQEIIDRLAAAGNPLNLVFLDACRSDPFPRSTRGAAQGLAKMDATLGMLISFATAPGNVAEDGTGRNSPYSRYLAETIGKPGLRIEDVLKRVRTRVREETNGRQITWDNSSIEGDFYFVPPASPAEAPARVEPGRKPLAAPRPLAEPGGAQPGNSGRPVTESPPKRADAPAVGSPKPGDTWTYRFRSRWPNVGERVLTARVIGVGPGEIRDTLGVEDAPSPGVEHRFDSRATVAERQAGGVTIAELNPYLAALADPSPGQRWESVAIADLPGSATPWNAQARVVAKETVATPAGEFEALRVQLDAQRTVIGGSVALTTEPARIDQTLWYAPSAKRLVRYTRRVVTASRRVLDEDTVELIRFELH